MHSFRDAPDPEFPSDEIDFPDSPPLTVPAGNYLCQFAGSCKKRTSQFAEGDFYYEMPLKIKNAAGTTFEYKFNFSNPKNQIYGQMLKLGGGKKLASGLIKAPLKTSILGKLFMAQVIQRPMKNNKNKLTNDIFRVWAYVPKKKIESEPEPGAQEEVDEEIKPIEKEFPKDAEEEIPF